MANNADPDETPRFAASHLGLRYLQMLYIESICINTLTTSLQLRTLYFRLATPLTNMIMLEPFLGLVVNPIMVGNFDFLFNYTPAGRTSYSMTVLT